METKMVRAVKEYTTKEDLHPLFYRIRKEEAKGRVEVPEGKHRCPYSGEIFNPNMHGWRVNFYGKLRTLYRPVMENLALINLRCLGTYVLKSDPRLEGRIKSAPNCWGWCYLEENEQRLIDEGELVVADDTGNVILRDYANRVYDTDEYYENTDDIVYVNGTDNWYTYDYAMDNYYENEDGEWQDEPVRPRLNDYGEKPEEYHGFITEKGRTDAPLDKQLYFGIEIELEFDGSNSEEVMDIASAHKFIACEDGSLDHGFELKGTPMSFNVVRKKVQDVFAAMDERGIGYEAESTCGTHIHISRAGMTDLQVGHIQKFMYCSKANDFITFIAGRKPNQYCYRDLDAYGITARLGTYRAWDEEKGDYKFDASGSIIIKRGHRASTHRHRYEALNILNGHTIEFRLFAGADNAKTVCGYIEFVKALVEITSDTKRVKDLTADIFIDYVRKNRKTFPALYDVCKVYAERKGRVDLVDLKADRGVPRKVRKQLVSEQKRSDVKKQKLLEAA